MDIDMNKEHWANEGCPKYDCRKAACKCGLRFVDIPAALGDDSKGSNVAPKNGEYCNAIVRYEANGRVYIYSKEGVPVLAGSDIESLEKMIKKEILDRQDADNVLQKEIDDLKNSPDVVDIVATYAALQAYDTSKLGDNDIVRVLEDETHDGDSTYYKWDASTSSWVYVGGISVVANIIFYADGTESGSTRHIYKDVGLTQPATVQDLTEASESKQVVLRFDSSTSQQKRYFEGYLQNIDYYKTWSTYTFRFFIDSKYYEYTAHSLSGSSYTFSESDVQEKLTAGTNVNISAQNVISATDTTYSNFTGTDGIDPGTAGLVPAPATTDAGKFLKADGTWETVIGDTVYSDKTTSDSAKGGAVYIGNLNSNQEEQPDPTTTDSHNKYFWALPYSNSSIPDRDSINILGDGAAFRSVVIGYGANNISSGEGIAIGPTATLNNAPDGVAIGNSAYIGTGLTGSVALGYKAMPTRSGEVNIGNFASEGFNSSQYRVLGGVYDAQDGHDAVNLSQLNGRVLQNAGAPTTATVGTVGQLLEDTTNGKLYQCTAIDTTDPQNPSYTWTEVGAGGGGPTVVQTTGTSQTDVMSQNAVTSMVFADPSATKRVKIGNYTQTARDWSVAIGSGSNNGSLHGARAGQQGVAIGYVSEASSGSTAIGAGASAGVYNGSQLTSTALGSDSNASYTGSVALGARSATTRDGEVNIGTSYASLGFNSTNYRVIGGVHDGQDLHDAATVAQGNTLATAAPSTSTVGVLGQLLTDTTNMHTYQCTAISGSTYTWQMRW